MAKIDTESITNFAEMSADELRAFISGFEYDDNTTEVNRYKNANSKANSEVAELKRQLKAKMSEEELKKAELDEKFNGLQSQLDEALETNKMLKRNAEVSDLAKEYIAMGYDAELATTTAKAFIDGDRATVLANQKLVNANREQSIKAELLKGTPTPPAGSPSPTVNKETFLKMSTSEQAKFIADNPDWKTKLT